MIEKLTTRYDPSYVKAIENNQCNRCFSKRIFSDSQNVSYCIECFGMGEVNSLMYLKRTKRKVVINPFEIELEFSLSDYQLRGSEFFLSCYKRKKSAFLQAVCGAGKTEMILELIKLAIESGDVVCFCIPRVEIIKQIADRLKKYLPKLKICVLHGDKKIINDSPLIITTPQQLINFYHEFDLMIIDEVDAFPYSGNPFLERLVHKSMNFNALLFVMSATITTELSKLIKTKQIEYFEIFVRYHLRELPVPILKKSLFFMSDLAVAEIIRLSRDKQKLIVYVSSIKKAQSLSNKLNSLNFKNQIISSKTVYKNEVIKGFEADDFNIIVSTTILERGVTFANLNVLVLEADHSVFSTSTLIQIAGRVGRNEMFGEIIFLSKYKSKAMLEAVDKIKEKNQKYAMQTM